MIVNTFQKERDLLTEELRKSRLREKALRKEIASIQQVRDTAAKIRETIYGLSEVDPTPPDWIKTLKKIEGKTFTVPMMLWSDWHYGETVNRSEMGGANEFNRAIAKRRIKRLVATAIDLARHHMGKVEIPGAVVCLGGDMITGGIHEELRNTNDGYVQQHLIELQDELCGALTVLRNKFKRLYIPCVIGNHGRTTFKPVHKGAVFESYEWNLYQQIEKYFKSDPDVKFLIPDEPDAFFPVLGHRFLLTHGDRLGVRGGDGIIGALGPIARGTFKVGRSESQIGRDFDTLLLGHWHTYIPRSEAVPVIVNGTLKGYDEFARLALRVPFSRPSQAMWFVHGKYGITAQWQIYLEDHKEALDTKIWGAWRVSK